MGELERELEHVGDAAMNSLSVLEGELPDATVTEAQKRSMKAQVAISELFRTSDELMYLAGAFEDAARRRRKQERRERSRGRHPRAARPPAFGGDGS